MLNVFEKVSNPGLRGLLVWVPMVKGDSALSAAELVTPEKRFVVQAWDSSRTIAEAISKTLRLNCPAWDVYLIYKPGVRWTGAAAPAPSFWMHQLNPRSGAKSALHLVPARFEKEVKDLLR